MEFSVGFGHHLLRRDSLRAVRANLLHSRLNLCVPGRSDLGCGKILDVRHQFFAQGDAPRRRPFQDFLLDGVLCNRHEASFRHELAFCKLSLDSSACTGVCVQESERAGMGRLVRVKRRATDKTRGRGRPRPILERVLRCTGGRKTEFFVD